MVIPGCSSIRARPKSVTLKWPSGEKQSPALARDVDQLVEVLESLEADRLEIDRHLIIDASRSSRFLLQDLGHDLIATASRKGRREGQKLVEGRPKGEDIRSVIERYPPGGDLLR